jgi:DNA-binding transcriptional ArsR family regulator
MNDLSALFVSRVRVKILQLFLSNPGQLFYIREIVRLLDEEINAVRRELQRLQKLGLMRSEWRGNRKYYEFRSDYHFYRELLGLVVKTTGLGKSLLKEKNKVGKTKYAFLNLAFARGGELEENQVALVLIGNIILPELSILVGEEEKRLDREIHYTVMTEEEFHYRKEHRDPFLISLLSVPRIMLIGDELEMVK